MKTLYDELYAKSPDIMGRPVHVANPDPLYNKIKIEKNGKYDVSSFAVANVNVNGGGSEPTGELLYENDALNFVISGDDDYADSWVEDLVLNYRSIIVEFDGERHKFDNISDYPAIESDFNDIYSVLFNKDIALYSAYSDYGSQLRSINAGNHSIKIWANSDPIKIKIYEGDIDTEMGTDYASAEPPIHPLNYSSIIVEINGTKYTLQNRAAERELSSDSDYFLFGSLWHNDLPVFSEYPFSLEYYDGDDTCYFATETAGTYFLKIWANSDPVIPGEDGGSDNVEF